MNIRKEVEIISNYIIRLRKHFHKYPELGMQEYETSARIKDELKNLDIPYISVGETGVIGILGRGDHVIALRADIDALRVQEKNEVNYASVNEGIMHACGHDAHTAALLGAAAVLKKYENELNCTVKLIFQPAEELSLGAKLIVDTGHLDGVEGIFGLHIFGDLPVGKISVEEGTRMAASDRFKIQLVGKSGHAGKPHQGIDATLVGAAVVMNLQSIISREFDPIDSAVVTIGKFTSGTQHNVISGEAVIEGTVRTFQNVDAKHIEHSIRRISLSTATAYNAVAHVDYQRSLHPEVNNEPNLTKIAQKAAKKVFDEADMIHVPQMMLGEDFSIYQQRVPGVFAFVGGGNESLGRAFPNHHERFNIDEKACLNGAMLHVAFVMEMVEKYTNSDFT